MEEQRKRKRLRPLWASAWQRRPLRWDIYRPWGRWAEARLRHRALVHVRERGGFNHRRFSRHRACMSRRGEAGLVCDVAGRCRARGGVRRFGGFRAGWRCARDGAASGRSLRHWANGGFDCLARYIFHARERALSYMHGVRLGFAGFHCRWLFLFRVRPCVRFDCVRHGSLFACLLSRVGCIGA